MKSSFLKNYKKKIISSTDIEKIDEAIEYAFRLTDLYGIERINKSILEASIMYKFDENILRERINDESFILNERKNNEWAYTRFKTKYYTKCSW